MTSPQIETERELIHTLEELNISSYLLDREELRVWYLEDFRDLYDKLKISNNEEVGEITDLEINGGCFSTYNPIKSFQYKTLKVLAGQHSRGKEEYSI